MDLVITEAGRQVLEWEVGLPADADAPRLEAFFRQQAGGHVGTGRLFIYDNRALHADISSGTVPVDGVAVAPCSMDTLSAAATGRSENLLERVIDVCLKEGRRLVVVPRETPLSRIHLRNLLTLAEAGAVVLPAMPAFYHRPAGLADLVDFIAGKALMALGLPQTLFTPWQGGAATPPAEPAP